MLDAQKIPARPRALPALACLPALLLACAAEEDEMLLEPAAQEQIETVTSSLLNVNNEVLPYRARAAWTDSFQGTFGTHLADVTGDGKADAVALNTNGIIVRRSNGGSFNAANEQWTAGAFVGNFSTYFADVTGDGKADAIAVNSGGVVVRRSNGAGFNGDETWTTTTFLGDFLTYFADVTGDGRADAIAVNNGGIIVRRSTGSLFSTTVENWTSNQFAGSVGTYFADVTGDGRADAIAVNNNGILVRRSNGTSFTSFNPAETWASAAFFGNAATYFADVTGDGAADAVAVNSDGVWMQRSNRFVFADTELVAEQAGVGMPHMADVTGDKRADIVEVDSNGIQVSKSRLRVVHLRFIQVSANANPVVTEAQINNTIGIANLVYGPLGISFLKAGSHLVTSAALATIETTCGNPCTGAPASEVAKLRNPFNPSCNIGDMTNATEQTQVARLTTRCGFSDEVPIVVADRQGSFGAYPPRLVIFTPFDLINSPGLLAHELGHYLGALPDFANGQLVGTFNPETQTNDGPSMFWDLMYRTSGSSFFTFSNRAEALAVESQLRVVQTTNPNNGWWCPSGDVNKPCPANPPSGMLGFRIANAVGGNQVFYSGDKILQGVGLRLPNRDWTLNVMSYNYDPAGPIQQRTPAFAQSQIEQIRRGMTFPTQTGYNNAAGQPIGAGREGLGRYLYGYHTAVFDAGDSRFYNDGAWAPGYKGQCAAYDWGVGVSAATSTNRTHSLLCSTTSFNPNFTGAQSTLDIRTTNFGYGTHPTGGDWDFGYLKGECGIDSVVTGLAQDPGTGALNYVRCSYIGSPGTSCRPRVLSSGDAREAPGNPIDWAEFYYKGECGNGSAIAGISRAVGSGAVHAILCCDYNVL